MTRRKTAVKKKSPTKKKTAKRSTKEIVAKSPATVVFGRAYEGAGKGKRVQNWRTPSTSVNAENLPALSTLRDRSRDLIRNNGYAAKAIAELVGNTIGTGIIAKISSPRAGAEKALRAAWESWAETTEIDADGLHDFYGLQALMARAMFEGGEVLIRRRWRNFSDGLSVPMQIQILESDYLDTTKNEELDDGGFIIQGVEFDRLGRRRAYWLFPNHPGDTTRFKRQASIRISGTEIIPLFEVLRPGQVRGIPRAAPVIIKMRDFDEAQDAALVSQKIASCFTAFVTKPLDAADEDGLEDGLPEKVEPGLLWELSPGQDVRFSQPPPFAGYKDFSQITLRSIAAGMRVPYEILAGDFSNVNFSSGRMSWIGFHRDVEMFRWITFIPRVCQGVFKWFLEAAALTGIEISGASSNWTPPRREMIDPIKEIQALRDAVRAGFMSLSEAIRQLGYEPREVMNELAADYKLLDELGIVVDSDPRKVMKSGMIQPKASESADGENVDAE